MEWVLAMNNSIKIGRDTSRPYKLDNLGRDTMYGVRLRTIIFFFIVFISACDVLPQAATAKPTRHISEATLAASPTVPIRTSDELYGNTNIGGQSDPTVAALPVDAPLPPLQSGIFNESGGQSVEIILEDGQAILADLYESTQLARSAGILLLARDRLTWGTLPAELMAAGYTVLVIEMPSVARFADMDVLLTSLSEEGKVDPARIAVIGAGEGADMALLGCSVYLICDAVVLLSPQSQDSLLNVLPNFNPRPMLVIAARNDSQSYDAATALSTAFAEGSQFMQPATGQGTGLLALNSDLHGAIVNWLSGVWD